MDPECLCVVPARGGSKRLPRKNILPLAGKPLIAWTIEAARESGIFSEVNVSTEDAEIESVARACGAVVPYRRSGELATDEATVVQVVLDMLGHYEAAGRRVRSVCTLLPTTPLRTAADIREAHARFAAAEADYLMGVTNYYYNPFHAMTEAGGLLTPLWPEHKHTKIQDLPRPWVSNGAVYLVDAAAFKRDRTFYGRPLLGYFMPPERSVDIDSELELRLAACLLAGAGDEAD